jgi:hypothetical protein
MGKKTDLLRGMERPVILGGYELDKATLTPIRRPIPTYTDGRDTGADPVGDGTFRMYPSGDIVDFAERNRRLSAK